MTTYYSPGDPKRGSWKPTRKWLSGAIVGHLAIAAHFAASGEWNATEWGELFALWTALVPAYLLANDSTPTGDGVPSRR